MKITDLQINLKELEADKVKNRLARLEFIRWYAAWLKRTPNNVWSKAQKAVVEQF